MFQSPRLFQSCKSRLAAALIAFGSLAGAVNGAVIATITGGGDARVMSALNVFSTGPITESGYTWTSIATNNVYGRTSGWGLGSNGGWGAGLGFPYAGTTNSGAGSMTFTFDSDVSAVLAFVNYAPGIGTPTMEIFDSSNTLLETHVPVISTPGASHAGEDLGFERTQGDIRSIRFSNSYIVAANIRTSSPAAIPEPSSTALLGLGGLALMLRRRR